MFSVFSTNPFDTLVDEATSELIPNAQEDLVKNFEICDSIRGRAIPPSTALKSIKRRLLHYNPNVQLLALKLCDAVVKNGGRLVVREMAGRDFVDCCLGIITSSCTNPTVRELAMSLMEQWSLMFGQHRDLRFLMDQWEVFKREHSSEYTFPSAPCDLPIDTLTECEEAPEWTDSPACVRCHSVFTMTNRKHHCRACGGCVCGQCSGKQKRIPRFGYNEAVRVCDGCYYHDEPKGNSEPDDLSRAIQLSLQEKQHHDEDEELQTALALSQQDTNQPTPKPTQKVISSIERENIHLFSRLVHASPHMDPSLLRLAADMQAVKARIEQALLVGQVDRMERADLMRLKRVLEEAEKREREMRRGGSEADNIRDLLGL